MGLNFIMTKNGTEISIPWIDGRLADADGCPPDANWTEPPAQNGCERFGPSNGSWSGKGIVDYNVPDSLHGGTLVPSLARSHTYEYLPIRDATTAAGDHPMGNRPERRQETPGELPEACADF